MIEDVLGSAINELNRIRREQGEDVYREAAKNMAKMCLARGGKVAQFARVALGEIVDFDAVERELNDRAASYRQEPEPEPPKPPPPEAPPADEAMAKAIMGQVPGCETQAQFNAMMAAFDALRLLLAAIFTGNKASEVESHKALAKAIEVAVTATDISHKLRDVPEAATSKGSEEFKQPPKQFHEHDVQRELLNELATINRMDALNEWYASNRTRMDQVVSVSLRNVLFDAIKAKKAEVKQQQSD